MSRQKCNADQKFSRQMGKCIGKKQIVLEFNTDDLLHKFGVLSKGQSIDIDPSDFDTEVQDEAVEGVKEQYGIKGCDDSEIIGAIWDTEFDGYAVAYRKEILETLENILDSFEGIQYEYDSVEEQAGYSGRTSGIKDKKIDWDKTVVVVDEDFKHTINAMISGDGMFDVMGKHPERVISSKATLKEWMQSHFFWLKEYWDIYGRRPPKPDFDRLHNRVDFDRKYFKQNLRDRGCKLEE